MSLSILTSFYPYRLVLKRKEPVELKVQLKNVGDKQKMISMHMLADKNLAFDKTGLKNNIMEKIDALMPSEKREFTYTVFPKQFASPGKYKLSLKAMEHYQSYKYSEKEYSKEIELTVE